MKKRNLRDKDIKQLEMLVEKYGGEQLLDEGLGRKRLASMIGAGLIAGSTIVNGPKSCSHDDTPLAKALVAPNNPYGINNIDYKNILNKQNLVKEYISGILAKHGKTLADLKFDPDNLVLASYKYDYDLPLLLAQLQIESHFGTTPRAKETNSMFSVGAYDDGRDIVKYQNQNATIVPYIKLIKKDYLLNDQKDFRQLLKNFVNYEGKRYAQDKNYEDSLRRTRNSIVSKYPDLQNDYICLD